MLHPGGIIKENTYNVRSEHIQCKFFFTLLDYILLFYLCNHKVLQTLNSNDSHNYFV